MNNRTLEIPDESGVKSLVYYTQPGVESNYYGLKMIYNFLKNGGTCVFVSSSTTSSIIKNQFWELGLNIVPYYKKFIFVDAYNPLIMAPSKEKYVVSNPDNIKDFSETIQKLLKEIPSSLIFFDSLSTIMDLCGEEETIEAVRIWNRIAKLYGHDIVYKFTAWPYSRKTLTTIQKELFTSVISIGSIAGTLLTRQNSGYPNQIVFNR